MNLGARTVAQWQNVFLACRSFNPQHQPKEKFILKRYEFRTKFPKHGGFFK
jgi:hypothetical protein